MTTSAVTPITTQQLLSVRVLRRGLETAYSKSGAIGGLEMENVGSWFLSLRQDIVAAHAVSSNPH
jgi:hypothetical protein